MCSHLSGSGWTPLESTAQVSLEWQATKWGSGMEKKVSLLYLFPARLSTQLDSNSQSIFLKPLQLCSHLGFDFSQDYIRSLFGNIWWVTNVLGILRPCVIWATTTSVAEISFLKTIWTLDQMVSAVKECRQPLSWHRKISHIEFLVFD